MVNIVAPLSQRGQYVGSVESVKKVNMVASL